MTESAVGVAATDEIVPMALALMYAGYSVLCPGPDWSAIPERWASSEGLEAPATPWDAAGVETGVVVVCCSCWSWVEWEDIALDAAMAALSKTFSSLGLLDSTSLSLASSGGRWDQAAPATLSPLDLSIYGRPM